jgi:HNH endonuclease
MITLERLKELLTYNPETGLFTRNIFTNYINKVGFYDTKGYLRTRIDGENYSVHRLIWFYMTGAWPKDQIDHINGIKDDNKWNNLREATNGQNAINKASFSKLGIKGVRIDPKYKYKTKYIAQITTNKKVICLGRFDTIEEASNSYNEAAKKYHGEKFIHKSIK